MEQCVNCHHPLGVGRFCVNCGHPIGTEAGEVGWRTGTAERPAVTAPGAPPVPPPPVLAEPPPSLPPPGEPRFPLYADEVGGGARVPREPDPGPILPVDLVAPETDRVDRDRRSGSVLPWLAGALVLLLMAGGGALLLLDRGDDASASDTSSAADAASSPSPTPSSSPSFEPVNPPAPSPTKPPRPRAEDLTRQASVTAPTPAPPSQDTSGNAVRYDAEFMLDQVSGTAWRMPGDGSGSEIVVVLPSTTTITRLGLVNGYAKRDEGYDGYTSNRRITEVEWSFDDGTVVPQQLAEERGMQTIAIDRVTTTVVRLRIVAVTGPGEGRSGRDFTAISDLRLVGSAA